MTRRRVAALAATLALTLAAATTGCSTADEDLGPAPAVVQPTAEQYFGTLTLARGSSIESSVQGVASVDDIELVDAPLGIAVSLFEAADETVRLGVEATDNADPGPQDLIFDIHGEPEPVTWTIQVT